MYHSYRKLIVALTKIYLSYFSNGGNA